MSELHTLKKLALVVPALDRSSGVLLVNTVYGELEFKRYSSCW